MVFEFPGPKKRGRKKKENPYAIFGFGGFTKKKRKNITSAVKREVLVRQNYRCAICRKKLPATYHIHHKVPISEGGTNDISNLIAVCPNCHADLHHKKRINKHKPKKKDPIKQLFGGWGFG